MQPISTRKVERVLFKNSANSFILFPCRTTQASCAVLSGTWHLPPASKAKKPFSIRAITRCLRSLLSAMVLKNEFDPTSTFFVSLVLSLIHFVFLCFIYSIYCPIYLRKIIFPCRTHNKIEQILVSQIVVHSWTKWLTSDHEQYLRSETLKLSVRHQLFQRLYILSTPSVKQPLDGQYFCTILLCNNIDVAPRRSVLLQNNIAQYYCAIVFTFS